jgi:hypothetical protein
MIAAREADNGLSAGAMVTGARDTCRHGANSKKPVNSVSTEIRRVLWPHCRPPAGNLNLGFGRTCNYWAAQDSNRLRILRKKRGFAKWAAQNPAHLAHGTAPWTPTWRPWSRRGRGCLRRSRRAFWRWSARRSDGERTISCGPAVGVGNPAAGFAGRTYNAGGCEALPLFPILRRRPRPTECLTTWPAMRPAARGTTSPTWASGNRSARRTLLRRPAGPQPDGPGAGRNPTGSPGNATAVDAGRHRPGRRARTGSGRRGG